MAEIIAFFNESIKGIPYPLWICCCAIAAICLVTELIKLPIKKITISKTNNSTLSKKAQVTFMLIPVCVGIAASGIISIFGYDFAVTYGTALGGASSVLFKIGEIIFQKAQNGEDITADTITEVITEVKNEQQAAITETTETVQEVVSAVVQSTAEKSAEDKFNELVEQMKQGK